MSQTAEEVYESLPQSVTFADIQRLGGPRATAMRRWLRDNVPAYLSRRQNRTVLDKTKDRELIMLLLSRIGSGTSRGLVTPDAEDNAAMLASISGTRPASAASVQGNARAESRGEEQARKQADAENKRAGARS